MARDHESATAAPARAPDAPQRPAAAGATLAAVARARGVVLAPGATAFSNRSAARILARQAAGPGRNPVNGQFRQEVVAVLKPFAETVLTPGAGGKPDVFGAAEGTKLFDDFITPGSADNARRETADQVRLGKTGKDTRWTGCIAFLSGVLSRGATASGATMPGMGKGAEQAALKVPGAWHPGSEVETNSPLPGDVYVFHYPDDHPKRPGYFSHTGLVWAVEKQPDGTQVWWTIDGGQGTAGVYVSTVVDDKVTYTSTQKGAEQILKRRRIYDPRTKRMKGGENDDKDDRVLRGWIDIDQFVTPAPGYGYAYGDDPINTGAFGGEPAVKPGPVRTTVIRPRD